MSQKPILQLQNVSFAIRENREANQLFRSVNLDVTEGDRLGILGASGSGKSMMAALATLSLPKILDFVSEGEISVYQNENRQSFSGTKTKQLKAIIAQQVGMVFQEPTSILNPLLT
ncbi:MAG: ATP-binding cassette domain-containing protein, partial [Bacteroidetes bacterium]|nr:ATP-binding cassette domain-containing protein [Bacteroidota bacterium]